MEKGAGAAALAAPPGAAKAAAARSIEALERSRPIFILSHQFGAVEALGIVPPGQLWPDWKHSQCSMVRMTVDKCGKRRRSERHRQRLPVMRHEKGCCLIRESWHGGANKSERNGR